jgi:hypothetical protein
MQNVGGAAAAAHRSNSDRLHADSAAKRPADERVGRKTHTEVRAGGQFFAKKCRIWYDCIAALRK